MGDFVEAARLEEVPAGTGKTVTIACKQVGLFNVDGQIYAIDDSCLTKGRRWEWEGSMAKSLPAAPME